MSNPWITHVKKVQKEQKITYKEALKEAKKTYIKGAGILDNGIKLLQSRPNSIKKLLQKYGNQRIVSIDVCRTPVVSLITKALNFLSGNAFKKEVEKFSYDDLFHLFLVIHLDDRTAIRSERNEVITATTKLNKTDNTECMANASIIKRITVRELFEKAEEQKKNFYRYNPATNNCQEYALDLLNIMNVDKPFKDFVKQDFSKAWQSNPKLKRFAVSITDIAGVARRLMGAGTCKTHTRKAFKKISK